MADLTYREQIDAKRIESIRSILNELPTACGDFIRSIAVTTGSFTRLAYTIDMKTFFQFLTMERFRFSQKPLYMFTDEDLAAVSQSDLVAYVEYLTMYFKNDDEASEAAPLKPIRNHELSIKRKLCSLRSFYDYLFVNKRVPANVAQLVALPKVHEKPILYLNDSEINRMLSIALSGDHLTNKQKEYQQITAKRDYAMLMLFLGTGIRVSECVGINISDIDLEENAFLVTRKGGNQVILYFPPEVAEALAAYLEERRKIETIPQNEDALFLSLQRKRINQRTVQNLVKKYASIAAPLKTKISPHKLRSTYATHLYDATGDIYLVADALGHSSVETTKKHYADMRQQRRKSAAGYVKLPGRQPEIQKSKLQKEQAEKHEDQQNG